ncbi:hypothetical protein HDU93_009485 [Gonapodya sp. JEL0774]|nr:hypothetical protein HDU93_009485 [Gonapodya sp. JEL0774]
MESSARDRSPVRSVYAGETFGTLGSSALRQNETYRGLTSAGSNSSSLAPPSPPSNVSSNLYTALPPIPNASQYDNPQTTTIPTSSSSSTYATSSRLQVLESRLTDVESELKVWRDRARSAEAKLASQNNADDAGRRAELETLVKTFRERVVDLEGALEEAKDNGFVRAPVRGRRGGGGGASASTATSTVPGSANTAAAEKELAITRDALTALEAKHKDLDTKFTSLLLQNASLEKDLQIARENLTAEKSQRRQLERDIERLNREADGTAGSLSGNRVELERFKRDLATEQARRADLERDKKDLEKQLMTAMSSAVRHDGQSGSVEEDERVRDAERRVMEAERARKEAEVKTTDMEKRAQNAERKAEEAEQIAAQSIQRVEDAEIRAAGALRQAEESQKLASDSAQKLNAAEARASEAARWATDANALENDLRDQIEKYESLSKASEARARTAEERASELDKTLQRTRTEVRSLEQRAMELARALEAAEERDTTELLEKEREKTTRLEVKIADVEKQVSEKNVAIANMHAELAAARADSAAAHLALETPRPRSPGTTQQIAELERSLAVATTRAEQAAREVADKVRRAEREAAAREAQLKADLAAKDAKLARLEADGLGARATALGDGPTEAGGARVEELERQLNEKAARIAELEKSFAVNKHHKSPSSSQGELRSPSVASTGAGSSSAGTVQAPSPPPPQSPATVSLLTTPAQPQASTSSFRTQASSSSAGSSGIPVKKVLFVAAAYSAQQADELTLVVGDEIFCIAHFADG